MRLARARWLLAMLVVAAAATPAAEADILARPASPMSLDQRLGYQRAVIRHDTTTLRWLQHHPLQRAAFASPVGYIRILHKRQAVGHHALLQRRWTRREASETVRAIRARDERLIAARARAERHRLVYSYAEPDCTALAASGLAPHCWSFVCIHGHEGDWNDPNAPYYGGLQMDWDFQHTYGPEFLARYGTADHWPPSVQMIVAERAYASGRGFGPWPKTRRMCGV